MNKRNLFRILLLSSFLMFFFSGFSTSIKDNKTNTKSNNLNSSLLVVPTITSQPATLDVCAGEAISLSVTATGNGPLSYQWRKDGADIAGETSNTFSISNSTASDAGDYQCVVTDDDGSTTSATTSVSVNSLPIVAIGGNLIICEDQTTNLTATGAIDYDWGSGFTNEASFLVENLSASSTFTVIGKNLAGCTASASVTVEVSPVPTASVTTSNGSVCSGSNAQFIISGTPNAVVTYKLNSGSDTSITLNNSGEFSVSIPNVSSDQTVDLVKVNNTNCETFLSTSETVFVEPITDMPIVSPISYCQDDTTSELTATGIDLKWYIASTSGSPLSQAPTPNSSNTGTFSYYVSQTINGCESPRAEIQVQVNPKPVISISGDNTICLGEKVVLTAAGGTSYVWNPGGETSPSITVSPTSNTTYTVVGTDADNCSNSATFSVNVNTLPTANLSTSSSSICSGEDAIFTISGTPNATVVYSIDSGANQTVVLDAAGAATISETNQLTDIEMSLISVNNSVCSSTLSDSVTITVNPNATAPAVNSPVDYCLNETATTLTAAVDTGNNLVWYDFDGTQLSSAPTPDTSKSGDVTYEVSQVNASGCESPRSQITVIVNPLPFAPTVANSVVNLCLNEAALPLDTSGISNPRWYDDLTSGNFLGNSYTPVTSSDGTTNVFVSETSYTPVTSSDGTTNVYVSETINGCEGPRTEVKVNVSPLPSAPSVASSSVFYCKNETPDPLSDTTSTSGTLNWYLVPTGGVGSVNPPIIDTSLVGSNTYYVSETSNLGCEGPRTAITVTVNDIPSTPSIGSLTNPTCSVPTGSIELSNLPSGTWTIKNKTDGTTYSDSTPSYVVQGLAAGTYSFVVSNGTCESEATSPVTINSVPVQSPPVVGPLVQVPVQSPPVVGPLVQPSCTTATGSVTLTNLPSTGNWTLTRVSDNVSLTGSGTSKTISGLPSGTHNYTVTNSQGCTSVASLNIVIDAQPTLPNAPIANAQSFLESDSATIANLQISSSGSPVWYNQAVSGTQYATNFPLVTGEYFAAQIDASSGCESVDRTRVSVTVSPASVGGSVSGTTTVCSGTNSTR